MTLRFTLEELRRARTFHQRLCDRSRSDSPTQIVRDCCALQAQEQASARLALHARGKAFTEADVNHAREVERGFVLTWSVRGTLHLVAAEDLRWLIALCGPGAIRATRRRYQQLGLTEGIRERALTEIEAILAVEGPLKRPALARRLAARGIPVAGQAIHHLVRFAALRGQICLGPAIDGVLTYVLLGDWLPATATGRAPADPAAELARRYLRAYAPATRDDFARWSGLGKRAVRAAWAAIAPDCETVTIPRGEALMLRQHIERLDSAPAATTARMLPRYDNYLLGYESRAFMLADAHAKRVHPGGGLIRTCVIVDGEAKANWKLERRRKGIRISIDPFKRLKPGVTALLKAEAAALGDFLRAPVELHLKYG